MTQKVLWRIFKTYFPIKGITKAKREFTISLNDLGIFEFKPKNHDTKPKNRKAPQGGSLTALQALNLYGVFRLVNELHKKGLPIQSEMVISKGKRIAKYYL